MAHEMIITEQRDRVGIITFNRPERMNALHPTMMGEVRAQIDEWNSDDGVGAIVLTGAGRAFSSGADIGGWQRSIEARERGEEAQRQAEEESWVLFCQRSKPLICAINGASIGAGLTITLPCDVRIASDQARLSMRFVRVGVIPELASTHILAHIVGQSHALELMLSGRIINAEEAGRIGLVNRVVPHEKLIEEAAATAQEIAFNPTESLFAIKKLAWQNLAEGDIPTVQKREREEFAAALARPRFKEAVSAFLEKRQPDFHKR
ncbi:MAG: enoyl-CoA hydratase/isomerase family protein [Candidatus Bathyarchaeota archaeon]|nr:enoyl-CoA hydratase/isomerase family protein [Candidatus Bathyarchaeota archaeon]